MSEEKKDPEVSDGVVVAVIVVICLTVLAMTWMVTGGGAC